MKEKDKGLEVLIRLEHFRTLSEMARGMVHEFNQPLSGIRAFSENILISFENGWEIGADEIKHKMQRIIQQVDRMSELIDHVRDFSHDDLRHEIIKVNVIKVVESAIQIVLAQFRSRGILLELQKEDSPLFIKANPFALEEVILNLLYNARDAVQDFSANSQNKTCSVTVAVKKIESKTTTSRQDAVIEVSDTGGGIVLGLTSAKFIVENFKGNLDIISNKGYGATAVLTFPLFDLPPPP